MRQINPSKYNVDSAKAYYAGYRDSVAVDWDYDLEKAFTTIWIEKGGKYVVENTSYMEMQYYIVPIFIAVITATIIFAFVLLRDSEQALKQKKEDSILGMMRNK